MIENRGKLLLLVDRIFGRSFQVTVTPVPVKPSAHSAFIDYANGQMTLHLNGARGEAYRIQTTTDLQNRSAFDDGIAGADGLVERCLSAKPSQALCFYRILWP